MYGRGVRMVLWGVVFWASFCVDLHAGPRTRDIYFGYYADGQRYGSLHVTVNRQPDGNYCYVSEARVLTDLLGAQKLENIERQKLVITPEYKPVLVETESASAAGKRTAIGSFKEGKLCGKLKRGKIETVRTLDLSKPVLFFACLSDWLNEPEIENRLGPVKFSIVDGGSFIAYEARAEKNKTDDGSASWAVDLGPELGQGEMIFGPDGFIQAVHMQIPAVRYERCSKEESQDIRHRVMKGSEVLSFPLTKPISRPDLLTSLRVALDWTELDRNRLNLEDQRQHIATATEKDGRHHVVIEILPTEPVKRSAKFPIGGDEFAPYLADTRFIKPSNESIRTKAREWTKGCQTSLEAVQALSKAIGNYLKGGTLIAETLSGPEVLQTKQGKCSEHATLLASLTRSLGIPTRIVLGMRMLGGRWIGHMWNEVYVGRWITVDTTVDEVGDSMQLVKLVHSDTVLGTQSARWILTKSLEVTVDDFQVAADPLAERYTTGVAGRVYTNVAHACRLTAASDDWTIEDKTKNGPTLVSFKTPDTGVQIHFVAFPLPKAIDLTIIVNARKQRFSSIYKQFKILENDAFRFGQISGQTLVFERAANDKEPGTTKTTEMLWRNGGSCFLLNIIAEKSLHDEYLPKFNALLNSFEILEDKK